MFVCGGKFYFFPKIIFTQVLKIFEKKKKRIVKYTCEILKITSYYG